MGRRIKAGLLTTTRFEKAQTSKGIIKVELIRFRRLGNSYWEIAFNEKHLNVKLNGDVAEVIMPAKSVFVRFWRLFFSLKEINGGTINTNT